MGHDKDVYHQKSCCVVSHVRGDMTSYGSRAKGLSIVGDIHDFFLYFLKFSYQHVLPETCSIIHVFCKRHKFMVYFCVV
jgi:hypothetical protein